jgi:phosphate transport system protein
MTDHTVKAFDSELGSLQGVIAEMGTHSRRMLSDAMSALTSLDVDLATSVISADAHINTLQRSVAHQAIHTIARRQPVAVDLREIIGAVRVAYDLERVGDLAKSIARRTEKVALAPDARRWMASLKPLSDRAALQLKNALAAYEQKDAALARTVSARDDKLDALEDFANRDLLTFMMENSANIPVCVELLFCVKGLDRIGDHATNLAETVIYIITGEEPVSG